MGRFDGLLGQQLDLAHQEALLVGELVVIGTILKESGEEFQQAIPVVDQNPLHGHRFVRICDKDLPNHILWLAHTNYRNVIERILDTYLEYMESFVLNHLSVVAQQFHAQFEVLPALDICHHHIVVGAV